MHRVQHISHSNVATANMRGQIKCWDLRADQDSPTSSMTASQQQVNELGRHCYSAADTGSAAWIRPPPLLQAEKCYPVLSEFHQSYQGFMICFDAPFTKNCFIKFHLCFYCPTGALNESI